MIGKILRGTPVLALLLFLVAPTVIVVVVSFGAASVIQFPPSQLSLEWYEQVFASEDWIAAIGRTAVVGIAAAALSCIAGTALAVAMASGSFSRIGRTIIEGLAIAPLAIPPVIIALGGYQMWSRAHLTGSIMGLIPLYAVLGIPFVFLTTVSVLQRLDRHLSMASASLGAGKFYTFRRIVLPLIAPAVLTGAGFAFVTSLDEVVLALFIAGGQAPTLPLQIFSKLTFGVTPDVAAVSTLQVAVTVAVALLAMAVGRRKARLLERSIATVKDQA